MTLGPITCTPVYPAPDSKPDPEERAAYAAWLRARHTQYEAAAHRKWVIAKARTLVK